MLGCIVLIGPMGSGKSAVGRHLAGLTSHRLADTDRLIVQRLRLPVPEIFARLGEPAFRDAERAALLEVRGWSRLIVATGGGIVERADNRATLREMGCTVWLRASPEALWRRVSHDTSRPLLRTADPRATLRAILERREPLYRESAHVVVETSDIRPDAVAAMVLKEAREFFARGIP